MMASLLEKFPEFMAFYPSIVALAVLCLATLVQSFLNAPLAFLTEEQSPGMPLKGDHSLRSFRVLRTYSNSTENLPTFGFAVLLAIIVGVSPTLVNWLAVLHVAFRLAFWGVYYSGVGKVAGGPRTLCYVGGALTNLILAGAIIYKLLS